MNILSWISTLVRNAVLDGFPQAVEELELKPDATDALAALRGRMAPALPAPDGDGRPARSGKSK